MADGSTRERLLEAAWDIARAAGVNEMRLADVAAKAGVSRQALYLHFENRATLLVEMVRRIDRTSGFRVRLRHARAAAPRPAFLRVLTEWFAYVPTILPVHRALEAASLVGGDGAAAYHDRMTEWRDALRLDVSRLADADLLQPGWSVDDAADWVWAHAHPTTVLHLSEERGWTYGAAATRIIRMLERELLVPNA